MSNTFRKVLALVLAVLMITSSLLLVACGEEEVVDPKNYTYNTYLSEFPDVWNNHTYQTATDSEIIGYTEPGFFTFDYNDTKDGYQIVPDMATKEPEDVTADYVGQFGLVEGDEAKAWKITIRNDIKWEDGTPIKAQDFVNSIKLLLNPQANNYRADNVYSGNLVLVGAKDYFYGGKYVKEAKPMIEFGYLQIDALTAGDKGQFKTENGDLWFNVNDGCQWSSNSLNDYYGAGYLADTPAEAKFKALLEAADDDGWVAVTKDVAETLMLCTAILHGYADADAYAAKAGDYAYEEWNEFVYLGSTFEEKAFDTVGIKALSETEIVIILEKPLEGFYLLYNLTGNLNLVKTDLYESLITVKDGVYNNTYGTSVETYMGYGPYKLTQFQDDKIIVLEKNPNWYGYNDAENKDLYQTTKIVYDCIADPETAMLAFLQGKLDAKGLDANQIKEYGSSEHLYNTDGASTFFIAMNPNLSALKSEQEKAGANINKTILTVKEFRMALSFALDRAAFIKACDPTGSPAFAVYNNLIISDPETGTAYRTTDEAKAALAKFWGVDDEIGEGKLYADIDEAIASVTGYNLDEGKRLFNLAYDKAIEAGLMDADDVVEIKIGTPNATSAFYTKGYEFLTNCYTEAVKGTKLEGKLKFTIDNTLGNGFADALRANQVDLLFGVGWSGSALDPYSLMEAYTAESYQYDPAWDTTAATIDIKLDSMGGKTYRASVWDWTQCMNGTEIDIYLVENGNVAEGTKAVKYACGADKELPSERLHILAAIEGAILDTYDMIPLDNDSSAALKGMQIKYYTEEYVYGVGRGGIKYMTYNYTDMQWDAFVAEKGGTINYK